MFRIVFRGQEYFVVVAQGSRGYMEVDICIFPHTHPITSQCVMSTKSKSKQEEALQILDDLDLLSPDSRAPGIDSAAPVPPPMTTNPGEAAEVLAFLDEITQKSSEPTRPAASLADRPLSRSGTPTLRKSTERVKVGGSSLTGPGTSFVRGVSPSTSSSNLAPVEKQQAAPQHERQSSDGGWGWGNVWSSASTALQQARSVVDEQVKSLPTQDTKKWKEGVLGYARNAQERAQEYAKSAQLDKLGSFCAIHYSDLNKYPSRPRFKACWPFNI